MCSSLGYKGHYVARDTSAYTEGEATFYRTSCFKLESYEGLVLKNLADEVCLQYSVDVL